MDINIPSQVKTFANLSAFPTTGSVKTIYIAEDSNIAYYWTGSAYQAISVQDVSGLQSKPVVVSSNITAQNDTVYHVVANATFTDPTPVEGRGYVVFVRNGTVTIGGIPQSNNSIYYRIFHSGAWVTYRFDNSVANNNNFVPQSRTINGKALTSNVTLTPSDIGAPSGSGTSTGTNTGDETKSSIDSKVGTFVDITSSCVITGWSSYTYAYIGMLVIGKMVTLRGRIIGTSNSTLVEIELPFVFRQEVGSSAYVVNSQCTNNGSPSSGRLFLTVDTVNPNLLVYQPTFPGTGTWTASGTKAINIDVTLELP
jgi:hypothetical protein